MLAGFFAAWATTELAPIVPRRRDRRHRRVRRARRARPLAGLGRRSRSPSVSWFGLASSVKGALQTRQAFAAALRGRARSELGCGPRPDGPPERRVGSSGRVCSSRSVSSARVCGASAICSTSTTAAGAIASTSSTAPTRRPGAPVLLQIHGGAWVIGNKDQQGMPLMYHLADKGWVCVAINYRLSPRATWPDHLVDCKRALAWIREHIAEYGGDPDYVVVTGGSAGGHLTAMMGLTANDPAYQPGLRGRRHDGAGDGAVLRRVRLDRSLRHPGRRRAADDAASARS